MGVVVGTKVKHVVRRVLARDRALLGPLNLLRTLLSDTEFLCWLAIKSHFKTKGLAIAVISKGPAEALLNIESAVGLTNQI